MFRVLSTPVEYAAPIINWVKKNVPAEVRRVAIVNPNDETGWDSREPPTTTYGKNGFTVVGGDLYERSLKDFQPMLTRILAEKPDIIELATSPPATAGLIVRQARNSATKGILSRSAALDRARSSRSLAKRRQKAPSTICW